MTESNKWKGFLPVVTILLIIVFWYVAAAIYNVELILPKPSSALRELINALGEREFWRGVGNTVLRSVLAFAFAFIAALALSLICAWKDVIFRLFYPVVVLLRALPTISVIFICYIAVRGWYRAILISFLVIFPTLFSSFYTAFKRCGGELADVGKVFGVKKRFVLTRYIIPSVWGGMYSDIVNTLSLTVKLIIAAEAVTATGISLGGLMAESKAMVDTGRILAYTVAAVALSYSTELIVRLTSLIVKGVSKKWRSH
ncbi:MAG: ABC transporter permease subunit [Clostridia bacterium]|nr:ABC transporter permease subunit [Clostridia bacterium]